MNLRRVLRGVCQVKKSSHIDPLVMRFSLKSEFLIGKVHQKFTCLVTPYSLLLQYRKSVLKKTQIFSPLFEPCSSCVAVDSFFSEQKTMSEKRDPPKGSFLSHVWQFLSKCPHRAPAGRPKDPQASPKGPPQRYPRSAQWAPPGVPLAATFFG